MRQSYDMQNAKSGDSDTFKKIFEFYYPRIMGLACRFVDEDTAKDLVQDVFVEYWEKEQKMNIKNISSYLYKTIQNKCLNHIKHQTIVDRFSTSEKIAQARIDYLARTTDDNETFRQISYQNLLEVIEISIGKLPPKCQKAFKLCYFHEMTCKEAAEIMGISPRTVEGHVQKAIDYLKKDLRPLLGWILLFLFRV